MDLQKSQEVEEFFDTIEFLYCKPFNSSYYSYSINSIENEHLIERQELHDLLYIYSRQLEKIDYLLSHFRKFIFIKESKLFKELHIKEDEEKYNNQIKEELIKSMIETPNTNKLENTKAYNIFKNLKKKFNFS